MSSCRSTSLSLVWEEWSSTGPLVEGREERLLARLSPLDCGRGEEVGVVGGGRVEGKREEGGVEGEREEGGTEREEGGVEREREEGGGGGGVEREGGGRCGEGEGGGRGRREREEMLRGEGGGVKGS